jgi:hypothetical protein
MASHIPTITRAGAGRNRCPKTVAGATIGDASGHRRNCMSQQDRIEALKEKHASLERALDEEIHRPLPDQAAIYDLKRQKLRIKDEIVQLERTH